MTYVPTQPAMPEPMDTGQLADEVVQLRAALVSRPEIEQAKGALMALHGCDADQAFTMLVSESQRQNKKLRDVAAEMLTSLRTKSEQ